MTDYYPDDFTKGEGFTAFSHREPCRIVGYVAVLDGTKDGGYIVEFVTEEHAGWKLVDEHRGMDFLWEPGYYSCSHADLTHLRRTDGEFWKSFKAADAFSCEKCGDCFHSYEPESPRGLLYRYQQRRHIDGRRLTEGPRRGA
jgi:hypothetical protein